MSTYDFSEIMIFAIKSSESTPNPVLKKFYEEAVINMNANGLILFGAILINYIKTKKKGKRNGQDNIDTNSVIS